MPVLSASSGAVKPSLSLALLQKFFTLTSGNGAGKSHRPLTRPRVDSDPAHSLLAGRVSCCSVGCSVQLEPGRDICVDAWLAVVQSQRILNV